MGSPGTERPRERCPRSLNHRDGGRLGPSCPFRLLDSLRYAYLLLTVLRNDRLIPHKRKVISLGALYYRVLCYQMSQANLFRPRRLGRALPYFLGVVSIPRPSRRDNEASVAALPGSSRELL